MKKVSDNEYRIDFFKINNYSRKQCKVCGTYFWTKATHREVCADVPCSDYYFFDLDIKTKPLTVSEARERFLRFFEKRGHKIVKPKPVLARWREDLYLTIASIVDFQPHVTSGLAPPPANPLVLSQPCIRLEDIDNVGITFGRHLTSFEMAAHHAFNYPDKYIYWKDETVNYAKEFFTQELGIPEEELNFKESWWEGGGNAGPSFEVTVGGLELATLVFMQYKVENSEYIPLNLKIVDTGYGVERIAWFTQKAPTAFHAIFGELVDKFFEKIGVAKVDNELLKVSAKYAGRIDPDRPETIKRHREIISNVLGLNINTVDQELIRAARVFQVLDHTKTLALMLADGLVPSNSGEGYLGRLVIRRTLRTLKLLNSDVKLSELIKYQIDYWQNDFPQMLRNKSYIIEVIEEEQEKFNEVLSKLPSVVSTYFKKGSITIDDLIQIYDSNGIPPDFITEEINKRGVKIEVPHNFYSLVAKRHQSAPIKVTKKLQLPDEVYSKIKELKPTRKLYYEDPYLREFRASIVAVIGKYLVLDKTAFYPEGGGQLGDTGVIEYNGQRYNVVDTQIVNDVILHILDREIIGNVGDEVKGIIDWRRRYKLMRHHTVTHIILAAARRVLGEHVWQAGAEKTPEKGRLDITHYRLPTQEEVKRIEDLANYIISDRRSVNSVIMSRTEAEELYGVSIYEGGVPNTPELRLVEIKDWDIEACGGTHVHNTSEIGGVKIINVEKLQDGVIRLEYVAGEVISEYARNLENIISEVSKIVNSPPSLLLNRISKIISERKESEKILDKYRSYIMKILLSKEPEIIGNTKIYIYDDMIDEELQKELMRILTSNQNSIVLSLIREDKLIKLNIASSKDINLMNIIQGFRELGLKGGGGKTYASFIIDTSRFKVEDIINEIKRRVGEGLRGL